MILVDTSVWIDHLRSGDEQLTQLLHQGRVLAHPFVTGEISLGNLANRSGIINALLSLPTAPVATDAEVLRFIDDARLFGSGIGYTDAHLLAACLLHPGSTLWTRDRRLLANATRMNLAANTAH